MRLDGGATLLEVDLPKRLRSSDLTDSERGLAERLIKGVLERRSELDSELDTLLTKGLESLPGPVQYALRLGLYQVRYLDRVPKEVAVSETVELVKDVSTAGLGKVVNAVLRRAASKSTPPPVDISDTSPEAIAKRHSHPVWLVERWVSEIGEVEAEELCRFDNTLWPINGRVNTLRVSVEEGLRQLTSQGAVVRHGSVVPETFVVEALPKGKRLHEFAAFIDGFITIQDESACLAAHLVNPTAGEVVVDLCAAPGGKTCHLSALMNNRGTVIAVDSAKKRLLSVKENCARLGATNVQIVCADGLTYELPGGADAVLIDAPCTGLGTLGRKKDLRWNRKLDDLRELHELQVALLQKAALLVRPGGRLVYTTCSVDSLENEASVQEFLSEAIDFELQPIPPDHIVAPLATAEGYVRTWPHRHRMGGSFGAVMRKTR